MFNFLFSTVLDYCHEAKVSLIHNKLRSFLSILGVVIGVAAVVAMLAIGTGAQKNVEKSMSALGTNLLMVRSSYSSRGIALGADSVTRFTFEDLESLQKIEGAARVVPYVSGRAQAVFQGKNVNTTVLGSNTDYQIARDSIPKEGRFFTKKEMNLRSKVAVLGATVAEQLFGRDDPIDKNIRINRINFTVIGVLPSKGISGFRNVDDQIVIPVTTAMYRLLGTDYISYFDVQAENPEAVDYLSDEIVAAIAKTHRLNESQTEQVEVRNMADIQKAASEMVSTFAFLLGAIAAVSLLVGGIGIMNIMLVMVMERTREIGLRKALGAKKRDILSQFLIEAVLICLLGGVIGIAVGTFISLLIGFVAQWNIFISIESIVLAFTFSISIGVIFGLSPAWKAANLQPIEALRYE
ncbi:hypothetical protein A2276_03030 [candidate division WOR-1 bacterium RIFOXYA12_FULL_43_27]|uniref:Multidrug ABC transporter substrate-binding protein n=1 Tax=candidate division WOR-1 bacterium RIFOXYC2_FULL_46_14 TaxID=1802587 RepID=A0A1F4U9D8_UNCSA|nr:MAG: hypothetical protein A2276_03030 [candidate division WOR-1 bacterium RIFOXYA12_FULL_43_27]OGC19323.1 MAG: hypothetical protein A2292_01305 [candidate division WOR-1 bacterium RIFOXYB2_FULL_46_45]OGC30312.1 MAG: hypothetical protein A2232_01305 [candidate division WOR-1 bacterium RIFOXYA2_FULL_46_56]OGC40913.1 MAG: hypothetical protein A2438_01305 [candidate division WOR-1 bacterium RIFOXYC2_FULL_46_14]